MKYSSCVLAIFLLSEKDQIASAFAPISGRSVSVASQALSSPSCCRGETPRVRSSTSSCISSRSRRSNSYTHLYGSFDPLARDGDWTAYLDEETTGLVYYFNGKTGESLWEPPTETFPPVKLSSKQKKIMEVKQREYELSRSAASSTTTTTVVAEEVGGEKKGGGFFSNMFGESKTESSVVEDVLTGDESYVMEEQQQRNEEAMATKTGSGFLGRVFGGGGGGSDKSKISPEPTETKEQEGIMPEAKKSKGFFFPTLQGKKKQYEVAEELSFSDNGINGDAATATEPPSEKKLPTLSFGNVFSGSGGKKEESSKTGTMKESPVVEDAVPAKKSSSVGVPPPSVSFPDMLSVFKGKKKEKDLIIPSDNPIKIEMSAFVLPHPDKVRWGGEDAVFTKGRTFGVFDGVSGAEKLDGVALYSKTLSDQMRKFVGTDGLTIDELNYLLTEAAEFADFEATGASTALVASVGEDGYLRALSLGDSVLLLIRDNTVVARTKEISHYFECPYQLGDGSPDRPDDGTTLKTDVRSGDLILLGSDGIFDNLSDEIICETVASVADRPPLIAKRIVEESRRISLDPNAETPYAKLAKKNRFENFENGLGGKLDDVSCIVVRCT